MARIPYTGVPTTEPNAAPPSDYQQINPNPGAFGGIIGGAEQQAGARIEQGAQDIAGVAILRQQRFNEVASDDAFNKFQTSVDNLTYGNPADPTAPKGLYSLRGADALNAGPQVVQQIAALRDGIKNGLANDAQRLQFEDASRRLTEYKSAEISRHLDQQSDVYGLAVNQGTMDQAARSASNTFNSDDAIANSIQESRTGAVRSAQISFGSQATPSILQDHIAKSDSNVITGAVSGALSQNNAIRAQQILDKFGTLVDPTTRERLSQAVRERADMQVGLSAAHSAINNVFGTTMPATTTPEAVHAALIGQESGANPNVRTSGSGAVGLGQIEPSTWAQYAKPGEHIDNAADNVAVSRRIVDDLYNRYNGDPARIAVGYFSGTGNIAPPGSPTPWKQDLVDPHSGGKPVSSYVADVAARLNAGKSDAYQRVMADPNLNDQQRQHALGYLNQQFAAAQIAAGATDKARKDSNEAATDDWVKKINSGSTPDMISQINNDPQITDGRTREWLIQLATKGSDAGSDIGKFGPGYADAYKAIFQPGFVVNDILKRGAPGGDLTQAGVSQIMKIYNESKKDPDEAGIHIAASSLLTYAKNKLSFEDDTGPIKIRDPKGETIYNAQFVPKFEAAFNAWRKDGKDPMAFLTQENVDKMMQGLRNPTQMAKDRLAATGETPEIAPEAPGTPIPQAPQGLNSSEWGKMMTSPPITATGQPYTHAAWATILQRLAANPEQGVKDFDAKFGSTGLSGAELLARLKQPNVPEDKSINQPNPLLGISP